MSLDLPGFADPVIDAQRAFRAILDAMSHPGRIVAAGSGLTPPAPLCAAAGASVLALVDQDVRLHVDQDALAAADWLRFHTGAALCGPAEGDFVLALSMPDLAGLAAGSDDAPELGATVILQVARLGAGRRFLISGPGLAAEAEFSIEGLPHDFAAVWEANHRRFPRGVDLILCAGESLAALPRSVRLREIS
jgi:alpha-D-ribose 1-methylphosphonate 5-triphosphate synthase subunit PhnH